MNKASDIMQLHKSEESMMAVLQEEDGTCIHDMTLQYLLSILGKVTLNTTVCIFWLRSIHKSLFGICSIFIYLADLLLVSSISWAWWFRDNINSHAIMCFSLSHSSTVYSLLPLPVLLAGTIDYATRQHEDFHYSSVYRTASQCTAVLLMWILACFYSYCFTDTEPLTIQYKHGINSVLCPVQGSAMVSHFSLTLSITVGFIILLYYRKLHRWICLVIKLSKHWDHSRDHMTNLTFTKELENLERGSETGQKSQVDDLQDHPHLFFSLILCFALSWTPYLFTTAICELTLAVPAYASVNLLWTACANSLVAGITFWYSSRYHGHLSKVPDEICSWNFYWHLSKKNCQPSASAIPHKGSSITFPEKEKAEIYGRIDRGGYVTSQGYMAKKLYDI